MKQAESYARKPLSEQIELARIVNAETGLAVTQAQLARWERMARRLEKARDD